MEGIEEAPPRSFCMRSIMITSLPATASSRRCATLTPSSSRPGGSMVGGAQQVTSVSNFFKANIFDRATRLWAMSPTIATFRPSRVSFFSLMVKRSRRAWVGCSWEPSPALTIAESRTFESIWGAPGMLCLMTMTSGRIDSRFLPVSFRVSPFATLLDARRYVDGVGGETLGRDLERDARPGARLVKKRDDRLAPQGGDLLDVPPRDVPERIGRIEKQEYLFPRQLPDAQ